MPSRDDPNSLSARARAAGIPISTLGYREARAQERSLAIRAVALDPDAPAWIGARIHPPIEPDHPLVLEHVERIRRRHGEAPPAPAAWPIVGNNG